MCHCVPIWGVFPALCPINLLCQHGAGRRVAQCYCNAPLFAQHAIGPATHHPPQGQWHRMSIIYTTNLYSHTILLWKEESDLDPLSMPHFNVSIKIIVCFAAFPPRSARVSADHNISSHLRGRGLHDKTGKQRTVTPVNNWSYCIFQIYRSIDNFIGLGNCKKSDD